MSGVVPRAALRVGVSEHPEEPCPPLPVESTAAGRAGESAGGGGGAIAAVERGSGAEVTCLCREVACRCRPELTRGVSVGESLMVMQPGGGAGGLPSHTPGPAQPHPGASSGAVPASAQ